jgi:hypothetical protein
MANRRLGDEVSSLLRHVISSQSIPVTHLPYRDAPRNDVCICEGQKTLRSELVEVAMAGYFQRRPPLSTLNVTS